MHRQSPNPFPINKCHPHASKKFPEQGHFTLLPHTQKGGRKQQLIPKHTWRDPTAKVLQDRTNMVGDGSLMRELALTDEELVSDTHPQSGLQR